MQVRLGTAMLLAMMAAPAMAADLGPVEAPTAPVAAAAPASDWRFQATMYGWLSGLSGDVGVKGIGPVGIDVSPGKAIQSLQGAAMASIGAYNQDWLLLGDFMWFKIGANGGVGDTQFAYDYTQNQITVQGLAGYRLPINVPNLDLRGTVGFRYQYLHADLNLGSVILPVGIERTGDVQWIDPTVGLYAKYDFNDRWFMTLIGDVGGFGVGSNFTWQGFGAVGYNWTKTISTSIGYRAIYEDYQSGGFVYNTTQQGAFVGLGIHW